jgi:DNA-nicking Smr family endonuclease
VSPTDNGDGGDDRVGKRGLRLREPVAGGSEPSEGSDDDDEAFAEAVRGARPLAQRDARVTAPPATPEPRRKRLATPALSPASFIVEQTGDTIAGRAPDVSLKVMRELRGGAHPVEARLDVHGRHRADALRALKSFVAGTHARGARGLLVIHGRGHGSDAGGPVLRPAIWDWLASAAAERSGVMAYVSARPRDGGAGATMILLRRSK